MTRKGTTSHVDHANTFYQIPADGNGLPMVFLHGYGQSRTGWQSTPDGREGWADIAKTPMLFLFGDYIDNGPQDIMSTGFWQAVLKQCRAFAEQYVKDGGDAVVIHLPERNIHGNSHFMFQEMNNKEIADLISEWITKHN